MNGPWRAKIRKKRPFHKGFRALTFALKNRPNENQVNAALAIKPNSAF
jgi:hypothetical protein